MRLLNVLVKEKASLHLDFPTRHRVESGRTFLKIKILFAEPALKNSTFWGAVYKSVF